MAGRQGEQDWQGDPLHVEMECMVSGLLIYAVDMCELDITLSPPRPVNRVKLVANDFAHLEWSSQVAGGQVHSRADSYVIRGGHIIAQTIHYYLQRQEGS